MIADNIWRLAMRNLPHNFTRVQIDGGNGRVRWFDQWQPLHGKRNVTAIAASSARRSRGARREWRIRAGVLTRASPHARLLAGRPGDIVHIRNFFRRFHQADRRETGIARERIHDVSFRIVRSTWPVRPAARGPERERGERSIQLALHRRREHWPDFVFRNNCQGLIAQRGCEVNQVVDGDTVAGVSGRLRRKWLGSRIPFARDITFFDWPLHDWPHRLASDAIEYIEEALFGGLRHGFYGAAIHIDIRQNGRR